MQSIKYAKSYWLNLQMFIFLVNILFLFFFTFYLTFFLNNKCKNELIVVYTLDQKEG